MPASPALACSGAQIVQRGGKLKSGEKNKEGEGPQPRAVFPAYIFFYRPQILNTLNRLDSPKWR